MKSRTNLANNFKRPLHLVYQPIIELKTGNIFGYEALLRGAPPSYNPDLLFRDAYRAGLASAFDLCSIQTALGSLTQIDKEKHLFLNIEPITLGECFRNKKQGDALVNLVKGSSSKIVFELTERLKPWDFEGLENSIANLKRVGCKLALDDVGGVGEELLELLILKPNFIKIDKGLVQNFSRSLIRKKTLRQLVSFCSKKKIKMIAEGIETKAELEHIKKLKVEYAQGHYFAKPVKEIFQNIKDY